MDKLVKQMAAAEGVTEELKRRDQMAWVGCMNNIRARADEIVRNDLIYV
ncbi:MAG: TnpV protein [Clostridia bacterium]|nr:TnpV protein [Clostridia bacterium]